MSFTCDLIFFLFSSVFKESINFVFIINFPSGVIGKSFTIGASNGQKKSFTIGASNNQKKSFTIGASNNQKKSFKIGASNSQKKSFKIGASNPEVISDFSCFIPSILKGNYFS